MDNEIPDAAVVRSILGELADTVRIDWSLPLTNWSQNQVISFLLLAWQLIAKADKAELHGKTFVLTLQPLPHVDPIRSLRWVLKVLLRPIRIALRRPARN